MAKKDGFAALHQLSEQHQEEDVQDQPKQDPKVPMPSLGEPKEEVPQLLATASTSEDKAAIRTSFTQVSQSTDSATKPQKRKQGRPQGRRSNPDYTQISAYIPLKLLLEVQNELAEERREKQRRSPRPVSDLIEELLAIWLHNRKARSGL